MNTEAVNSIKDKFSDKVKEFYEHNDKRFYILIDKDSLLEVVQFVFRDIGARYIIVSALDTPQGIEILYHFSYDKLGQVITIRVILPHDDLKIESISQIVTGAQWIEREIYDILGVTFLNHPDPRRFLMSDDWPEGVYPLRKEFKSND